MSADLLLTKSEKLSISMQGNSNAARHGHARHGQPDSPTYTSWQSMLSRCRYLARDTGGKYAARGIEVCTAWLSFDKFLLDMGERPDGTTIDRFPNKNGNYEPGNCRWATPREQARNTRRSKLTLETATEVAVMRLRGVQCKVIGQVFGVSESLPREIVKGRCWPDALVAAKKIIGDGK